MTPSEITQSAEETQNRLDLVNRVFVLSRTEAGKVTRFLEDFDVARVGVQKTPIPFCSGLIGKT